MTVATFLQPNFNTQDPTTYRGAIDADFAVAVPIIGNFAPHAAATPNMTVLIDAGAIPGVGGMPVQVAQQTSATLTAPSANPRKDIAYIDSVSGVIGIATGTEAASPVDPTIPAGKIPVARLAMTVGMTTIPNTIITDLRAPVMASGGVKFTAITADTTLTTAQSGTTFKLSGTGVDVTLPTPIGNAGTRYRFVGTDANTQTLATPAATFNAPDGTTSATWGITNNQVLDIEADGAVWRVMGMEGYVVAQTPATADNSTKVATTAFVKLRGDSLYEPLGQATPTGAIGMFAATAAPTGWLLCDGAAVSRTTYAALFAVIGTAWGAGDGSTTFNKPDLRGRGPVGSGTGSGLTARTLAQTGGAETHTLSTAEMPAHTHNVITIAGGAGGAHGLDAALFTDANSYSTAEATSSTGSGSSHNNMQPFAVVNFIIKT